MEKRGMAPANEESRDVKKITCATDWKLLRLLHRERVRVTAVLDDEAIPTWLDYKIRGV